MAVIRSDQVTASGEKSLTILLKALISQGKQLAVADRHAAAYLRSKQIADQYPTKVHSAADHTSFPQEHARGIISNLSV
jgi:hypothetical protein